MADLERTYNIPLRKEFRKAPRHERSKKAMTAVREFLLKHMKGVQVLIGQELNHEVWKDGIKNPPHHVKVLAKRDAEGIICAELVGHDYIVLQQKEKKEDDSSLVGRLKNKMGVDKMEEEEKKEAEAKATAQAEPAVKKEVPAEKKVPVAEKKEAPAEKKEEPKNAE